MFLVDWLEQNRRYRNCTQQRPTASQHQSGFVQGYIYQCKKHSQVIILDKIFFSMFHCVSLSNEYLIAVVLDTSFQFLNGKWLKGGLGNPLWNCVQLGKVPSLKTHICPWVRYFESELLKIYFSVSQCYSCSTIRKFYFFIFCQLSPELFSK